MKRFLEITTIIILSIGYIAILQSCKKITIPDVRTTEVSETTPTTAKSGGNVRNNGGAEVTARGVCWSTNQNPTTANSKTTDGSGNGLFESRLTELTANTGYYYRAYATNSEGTGYGEDLSFTTLLNKPDAAFTASLTTITAGQSVQFTDQSTNTPKSWNWDFGDGSTIKIQNPLHTYSTAGTYTVSLTVENNSGSDTETKSNYINVNPVVIATLTTNTVTSITSTTAVSGGNITNDGGGNITARGVCWNTSGNPTITDNKTTNGIGPGSFSSNLTGLSDGTTYYVRAYATNSAGTAYGDQISFITLVTDIEGNIYKTVKIGTQVWMAENLKVTKFNDLTNIPNIQDFAEWAIADSPAYCWYNNQSFYKDIYGAIYNWYTVNTGKLCPVGWHVPYISEWDTLNKYVERDSKKLREPGYNHWTCQEQGTNETGFTALPGGLRYSSDWYQNTNGFGLINSEIWFWSASIPQGSPQSFFIYCTGTQSAHNDSYQDGRYIRCIKN